MGLLTMEEKPFVTTKEENEEEKKKEVTYGAFQARLFDQTDGRNSKWDVRVVVNPGMSKAFDFIRNTYAACGIDITKNLTLYFCAVDLANKEGITADLSTAEGQEKMVKMIEKHVKHFNGLPPLQQPTVGQEQNQSAAEHMTR